MRCTACVAGCVVLAPLTASPASAAPYWVAWEGNDYPENEGWERVATITQPTRTLHVGVMTLDSLALDRSEDAYRMYGWNDPSFGEEFVVQWRLRVNQVDWDNESFPYDPGWSVNSADGWSVIFAIGVEQIENFIDQTTVSFEPGLFHTWEFRSADMRSFTIRLNGAPFWQGQFSQTLPGSRVSWGDLARGPTSNVDWDYFRFGVVPEPSTNLLLFAIWPLVQRRPR